MPSLVSIILLALFSADVLWWWRADRRARRLRHATGFRLLIGLFMGGQIALLLWILGGRFSAVSSFGRPPQILSAAAYLWHLLLLPICWTLVAATGFLSRVWQLGRALVRRTAPLPQATPPHGEATTGSANRREFLGMVTAAAPALLTGAGVAYSQRQLCEFRIRPLGVSLPGLPPELDGLTIALVSDLHVGTFTHGETVKRVVEETSRLEADLILLPGDLINNAVADLSDALDAVCNMQSRYGAYLCVGNHDLIEDGQEFVRRVRARVPLLVGESRVVPVRGQLVQLLGLPWNRGEAQIEDSVRGLAREITPGAFPILLAHHPHAFDAAAATGFRLRFPGTRTAASSCSVTRSASGHFCSATGRASTAGPGPTGPRWWSPTASATGSRCAPAPRPRSFTSPCGPGLAMKRGRPARSARRPPNPGAVGRSSRSPAIKSALASGGGAGVACRPAPPPPSGAALQ
jgi:predicted MPP superfamily phosphohydrolase